MQLHALAVGRQQCLCDAEHRGVRRQLADTRGLAEDLSAKDWVLVKGFNLSYHNKETILFTIDPHYGNLNKLP